MDWLRELSNPWVIAGFAGQACFAGRFLIQWIASERRRRSVVPIGFWYLSIAGAVIMLAYALYRQDPVFIVGQTTGLFIYCRNLYLISRQRKVEPAPG